MLQKVQSSLLLHAVAVAGRHRVDVDVDVVTIATSSGQEGRPKFNLRQPLQQLHNMYKVYKLQ